jgi:hypothetical protein
MNGFSASEAALEGFRLTRERPGTIAVWSVVYALTILVLGAVMLLSLGLPFIDYIKKGGLASGDAEGLADMLSHSWPAFLLVMVLVVTFLSVLTGGIYRLVLRPGEAGVAHLRLGADEFRLTAVNLALFAIGVFSLVAADLVVTAVSMSGGPAAGVLAGILAAIPAIWIGVRLSLATPITFAERRIAIGASWNFTRGRFWPLFGMIVLTLIFYVMIWVLMAMIISPLVALAGGPVNLLDMKHLGPGAILVGVVTILAQMLLPVLQWVIIYAPFAVAYQQLHGDEPANPLRMRPEHG